MRENHHKGVLGKIWHFIWEDDSLLSWIVNIILAIVLIKFLIYPGLGLALGTSFPIVAVVSDSMEHQNHMKTASLGFDGWWQVRSDFYTAMNISKSSFMEFPFRSGFNKGDLMVLTGAKNKDVKLGDIIVFMAGRPDPIIHRVVSIKNSNGSIVYETKGDNNQAQIETSWLNEKDVRQETIVGKAVFRIPYLGWVKIIAVDSVVSLANIFR